MINASFWTSASKTDRSNSSQQFVLESPEDLACAKYCPVGKKITYQLLLIGFFHKLISMQDVGHNLLHLHVAQQLPSFKQSKFKHH